MSRFRIRWASHVVLLGCLGGCAGILGIPSDVERDTELAAEAGVPDAQITSPKGEPDAEGGADTDAEIDGGPQAPCDLTRPFGGVVPLGSVNTSDDEGSPHLSEDELTLYLDAKRDGAFRVYFTTRSSMGNAFGALQALPSVDNSINVAGFLNVGPSVTTDGDTLFFARQGGPTDSDLWMATRQSPNDSFGTAAKIASLDTAGFEAEPYVRGDGTEVWFVRQPGNNPDLALATLSGGSYVVDTSGVLDRVNDPNYFDGYPVISNDRLTLYFASERPSGNAAFGSQDIWVATRASTSDPFGTPHVLDGTVNSTDRDYPGFISADGCRLYFSSVRPAGRGGQDLYVTTRPR